MSTSSLVLRRKLLFGLQCKPPKFYISYTNSINNSVEITNGMQYNHSSVYFFVSCEIDSVTAIGKVISYTSSGVEYDHFDFNKQLSNSYQLYILNSRSFSIPQNGYIEVYGICSHSGMYDSCKIDQYVYIDQQQINLYVNPSSGDYNFYKYITMYPFISGYYAQGADIRYTIDYNGNIPPDPTLLNGIQYTNPVLITSSCKIKAKAFDTLNLYANSDIVSKYYNISIIQLIPPTISPSSGTYNTVQEVSITNSNGIGDIYYALDETPVIGTDYTYKYNGKFDIAGDVTVNAIVYEPVTQSVSQIASASYFIVCIQEMSVNVKSITGDGCVLEGTLIWNYDIYGSYLDYNCQNLVYRPVVGFAFGSDNYSPFQHYYVQYFSPTISIINNVRIATVKFHLEINDLNPNTTYYFKGDAYLYFRVWNNSSYQDTFYPYTQSYTHITTSTYSFTTKSKRKQYSIYEGLPDCPVGRIQGCFIEEDNGRLGVHNYIITAILSSKNLSFKSNSDTPDGMKMWGFDPYIDTRYTRELNPVHGFIEFDQSYNTRMFYLQHPWSYIGNSFFYIDSPHNLLVFGNSNSMHNHVRDLFGWGTSFNSISPHQYCYQPWSTSESNLNYKAYGDVSSDLRNVRSAFLQIYPHTEPNSYGVYDYINHVFYDNDFSTLVPEQYRPKIYSDWGSIYDELWMITAYRSIRGYNSYPQIDNGWRGIYQSNQESLIHFDSRAFGIHQYQGYQEFYNRDRGSIATLSSSEWNYMLFQRSGSRFAKGRIQCEDFYHHNSQYVNGIFIFSDEWQSSSTTEFTQINNASASFTSNTVTEAQWNDVDKEFENSITFLPAGGYRIGTTCYADNTDGYYWTATHDSNNDNNALALHFNDSTVEIIGVQRCQGCSVRLARYVYT